MQVSSSVSNRYYTPYQTNKSVKHCAKDAGIENQAEDCKALFDFFATYTEKNEVKENTAIDFSRFAPNVPEEVK